MKKSNTFFAALLMLVLASSLGFAQRGGPNDPGDTTKGHRDTTITKDPRDTVNTKGPRDGGRPKVGSPRTFGLSDSCWLVFLQNIPADSARILVADLDSLRSVEASTKNLEGLLRRARQAKDTAAVKRITAALRGNRQTSKDLRKEIIFIVRSHQSIFIRVKNACMGEPPPHKGTPGNGDPQTELKMTPITPNPVLSGGTAAFSYSLPPNSANTQVNVLIVISDAMGNVVKNVFSGAVDASSEQKVQLDISGLKSGVYIIRVQAGNLVGSQKIMIQ